MHPKSLQNKAESKHSGAKNSKVRQLIAIPQSLLKQNVLTFVDNQTLARVCSINRFFNDIGKTEALWQELIKRLATDRPSLPRHPHKVTSYRALYAHAYILSLRIRRALESPTPKTNFYGLASVVFEYGYEKLLLLLRPMISLNVRFKKDHNTFLHIAALHGQDHMAKILLDAGVEPNPIDSAMMNVGLELKANPMGGIQMNPTPVLVDNSGFTPLMLAAGSGHERCMNILLRIQEVRININYRSRAYDTSALHEAVKFGCVSCVQLLIANGAKIDIENGRGEIPLHVAIDHKRTVCVNFLREEMTKRGMYIPQPPPSACVIQ